MLPCSEKGERIFGFSGESPESQVKRPLSISKAAIVMPSGLKGAAGMPSFRLVIMQKFFQHAYLLA